MVPGPSCGLKRCDGHDCGVKKQRDLWETGASLGLRALHSSLCEILVQSAAISSADAETQARVSSQGCQVGEPGWESHSEPVT